MSSAVAAAAATVGSWTSRDVLSADSMHCAICKLLGACAGEHQQQARTDVRQLPGVGNFGIPPQHVTLVGSARQIGRQLSAGSSLQLLLSTGSGADGQLTQSVCSPMDSSHKDQHTHVRLGGLMKLNLQRLTALHTVRIASCAICRCMACSAASTAALWWTSACTRRKPDCSSRWNLHLLIDLLAQSRARPHLTPRSAA